jgi:LuxR family quorum sensing-dependent transcriptional regulator
MSDHLLDAFDLIDGLSKLDSPASVGGMISPFAARFGLDHVLYTRLPLPKERLGPHTLYDTWPKDFWRTYESRRYYRDDPIADQAFRTTEPYLWSDVPIDHDRMPRARHVMGDASAAGLDVGMCIPVHDAWGFQAVITMAGAAMDLPPRAKSALGIVSLIAFGVMDRHARPLAATTPLSGRERELLMQLGLGRTMGQAADRMGITDSTAATLLVRARQKLGTLNATHTVVEALRLRQIQL